MALRAAARTELLRRACRKPPVSGAEQRSLSGHMPDKPPVLAEERDSHASRAANQGGTTKAYVASRPERTRGFLFGSWGFPPVAVAACRRGTAAPYERRERCDERTDESRADCPCAAAGAEGTRGGPLGHQALRPP